ncbi:hypothetical protein [Synechococcus sp. R5-13]|uniref:hypothetical protein n=1 Tax=Synechococcus sp. R5-13 TaxID=2291953 RepID=UPI0039C49AE6
MSFIRDPFAEVPKPADYASICSGDTRPLFFIGVDANQNYLGDTDNNPATLNHGLTSMLKRVDMATYEVIRSVVEGNFKATLRQLCRRHSNLWPGERGCGLCSG